MSMAAPAHSNPVKPRLRGVSHEIAFAVVAIAGPILVLTAPSAARGAAAIYALCLAGLFGVSAAFHRITWTPDARRRMRRLDHSMIFMLIAGTYTPICLVVLPRAWGIPTLVAIWVTALAGVIMKMIRVGTQGGKSGSWLYGVLGWSALITMPKLLTTLDVPQMILLAAGGALYTGGAIILGKRRPNPSPTIFGYHEVWHALTILAGGSHFAMVFLVVR